MSKTKKGRIIYDSTNDVNSSYLSFYVHQVKDQSGSHHELVLSDNHQVIRFPFNRVDFRRIGWKGIKMRFCDVRISAKRRDDDPFIHDFPWRWPGCCVEVFIDVAKHNLLWTTWWEDGHLHYGNLLMEIKDFKRFWKFIEKLGSMEHPVTRRPTI